MPPENTHPHLATVTSPDLSQDWFCLDSSCEPVEPCPTPVGDDPTPCQAGGSMPPDVGLDQMPFGICFLYGYGYLEPDRERMRHLCLACDRYDGSILAYGHGDTEAAARRAACEDLRDKRRGRVTLAAPHLTRTIH